MGRIQEVITRAIVLPGGSIDASGAYVQPLLATGGGVAIAAATANQALTVAAGAGSFGYMTDLNLIITATAVVAGTVSLLDASGGTVLWSFPYLAAGAVNQVIQIHFSNPVRTSIANGQFFITTTGAGVTWAASCNGYTDKVLGN
jgi:hypothetical protein